MHDCERDGHVRDRIKAVLLASESWSSAAAKELNINLRYLPPYSPNLNPIARLWNVMNEHVRNDIYFSSKQVFSSAINISFLV